MQQNGLSFSKWTSSKKSFRDKCSTFSSCSIRTKNFFSSNLTSCKNSYFQSNLFPLQCELIKCTDGTFCSVRSKGTIAKIGDRPFEQYLFPKCVRNEQELEMNIENDGNAHIEVGGPWVNLFKYLTCKSGICFA